VEELLKSGVCAVTGDGFQYTVYKGKYHRNPYTPSLDQIIAGEGYTMTNTQAVVWWFNNLKEDMSNDETIEIIRTTKLLKENGA
jgi:hypothetical protein